MRRIRVVVMVPPSLWCYSYPWLRPFAQSLLRFLGFIFSGSAALLAFGGIFVILMYMSYRCLFRESVLAVLGSLAVVVGLTLLPTGVLAISISAKSSHYKQGVLMYLVLVLLCLEISSGVMAQLYSVRMTSELKRTMGHLVSQYYGTHTQAPGNSPMDAIQRKLQCCGVQNYTDWLKATAASWHLLTEKARVPKSCCKEIYSHCEGDLGHLEQLFREGCLKKVEGWLWVVVFCMFWCSIVLSVLGLLAGFCNGILMQILSHRFQILDSFTFT
ncbi:tetraspanin-3-like [Heliangelus exortis]|uniref:tetraspanin-3-like n=1 Tax=Heliangelus exortis TaxID=472823 RepID=UPI003A8D38C4